MDRSCINIGGTNGYIVRSSARFEEKGNGFWLRHADRHGRKPPVERYSDWATATTAFVSSPHTSYPCLSGIVECRTVPRMSARSDGDGAIVEWRV